MIFLARYWRELLVGGLLLLAAAAVGVSRMQVNNCRANLAQFKAAYEQLARSVQTQNDAVLALEKKAAETARRAALARVEAGKAIEVAQRHADALAGFLGAPRVPSECPSADAIKVVRDDLRSQQTP
jgi:multidrug resistance efflux pump